MRFFMSCSFSQRLSVPKASLYADGTAVSVSVRKSSGYFYPAIRE